MSRLPLFAPRGINPLRVTGDGLVALDAVIQRRAT
jgi:hypothetical protein